MFFASLGVFYVSYLWLSFGLFFAKITLRRNIMFIDNSFLDEQAKEWLINLSQNNPDFPIRVDKDTLVKRFCEGGQSLPLNINNEYVVRLPKSQATFDEMKRESLITHTCAKYVHNTNISNVDIYENSDYPFAVHKSINGKTMDKEERENNVHYSQLSQKQKQLLAADLASFLYEMHQIPIAENKAIENNYIDYLQSDNFLKNKMTLLKYGINLQNYMPVKDEDMVCCHNDLHGRNIAIDETKDHVLQGVFDFGMCGVNKRSADFVKLYSIDRELGRKTIDEYNKLSPQKVDIKNVDAQFLSWCAVNIQMAEKLPEQDKNKIMSSMERRLGYFKEDVEKQNQKINSNDENVLKIKKLRGQIPSQPKTPHKTELNCANMEYLNNNCNG